MSRSIPPLAVSIQYDSNAQKWRASMNATKDELKNAPEFKYQGQWEASKS